MFILFLFHIFLILVNDSILKNGILYTCVHSNPVTWFHPISLRLDRFQRLQIRLCNTLHIISFRWIIKMSKICVHSCEFRIGLLWIVHVRAARISLSSHFDLVLWRIVHLLGVYQLAVCSWTLRCIFAFVDTVWRVGFYAGAWGCWNVS